MRGSVSIYIRVGKAEKSVSAGRIIGTASQVAGGEVDDGAIFPGRGLVGAEVWGWETGQVTAETFFEAGDGGEPDFEAAGEVFGF